MEMMIDALAGTLESSDVMVRIGPANEPGIQLEIDSIVKHVPAKSPDKLDDYSKARIGAVKGTTGEQALHQRFPQSRVLSYDDIPLALTALRNGNVQAITQDSTILAGLLAEAPDKANFKIIPDLLSKEEIGVGVKKGEPALLKAVNDELVKLEKSGEAAKIYDVWFGPSTKTPQPRAFTIEAK